MASSGSKKQITFDLSQKALKTNYPHSKNSRSPQYFKKAYTNIQHFMWKNGFEHRQYSVYTSAKKLTTVDIVKSMQDLAKEMPWLFQCVNQIDVTNVGPQYSLLHSLEEATIDLDIDLNKTS